MTPLYFFPGIEPDKLTREFLLDQGPADALRDCLDSDQGFKSVLKSNVNIGPSGSSGTLAAANPGDSAPELLFKPDRQRWVKFGTYWIGYFRDNRPTPAELQRPDQLNGYLEPLADGNLWNCPTIRIPYTEPRMMIPRKFGVDDDGNRVIDPIDEYRSAWETSAKIWDFILKGQTADVDVVLPWAAEMLSLNYRVSVNECLLLDLINEQNIIKIFVAACDRDFVDMCIKELKKNSE